MRRTECLSMRFNDTNCLIAIENRTLLQGKGIK